MSWSQRFSALRKAKGVAQDDDENDEMRQLFIAY